eukprot:gene6890-13968_t
MRNPHMTSPILLVSIFLLVSSYPVANWKNDKITLSWRQTQVSEYSTIASVNATSNGQIFLENAGHFFLQLELRSPRSTNISGRTNCINIMEASSRIISVIGSSVLYGSHGALHLNLSDLVHIYVRRYGSGRGYPNFSSSLDLEFSSSVLMNISAEVSTAGCAAPRTIREWTKPDSWVEGVVPNSSMDVIIPPGAGGIDIRENLTARSLHMAGGLLLGETTLCPTGWLPVYSSTSFSRSRKCVKLLDGLYTRPEAVSACMTHGLGLDATRTSVHLIQIESREEETMAIAMCSGSRKSPAGAHGCWIGLSDLHQSGEWTWDHPTATLHGLYRDWRRFEPSNITVHDTRAGHGEQCAHLVPWLDDPLIREQGAWNDASCDERKAALCEVIGTSVRYSVNFLHPSSLLGGGMMGGIYRFHAHTNISDFTVDRSSVTCLNTTVSPYSATISGSVKLLNGASLTAAAREVLLVAPGNVGETYTASDCRGSLVLQNGAVVVCGRHVAASESSSSCRFKLNVSLALSGNLHIDTAVSLDLLQGGDLSGGSISTMTGSSLVVAEYPMKASEFDSFELRLSHRGDVVGEYRNVTVAENYDSNNAAAMSGVYRIKAFLMGSSSPPIPPQRSLCIAYNATADHLASILNTIPLVQKRGGGRVNVRRYGNGRESSDFGYTYRIDLDGTSTSDTAQGDSLQLELDCYGVTCRCSETVVSLRENPGPNPAVSVCPRKKSISNIDPNICVLPPFISMEGIGKAKFLHASGDGSLVILSGKHRLSPLSSMKTVVMGGVAIMAADVINYGDLTVSSTGVVISAGRGWAGWDSANLLYEADWTVRRGLADLNFAPSFAMNVSSLHLTDNGSLLFAGPKAHVSLLQSVVWAGGTLGGRSQITLLGNMMCSGLLDKLLRYGSSLTIGLHGVMDWSSGNFGMYEGSSIEVLGQLIINTGHVGATGSNWTLGTVQVPLPVPQSFHQWHGYYDDNLVSELRTGWYGNPLCGEKCLSVANLTVHSGGRLSSFTNSSSLLTVPVYFLAGSMLSVDGYSTLTMMSGGACEDSVVLGITVGSVLQFGGGMFAMAPRCSTKGRGDVLVTGGEHELGAVIEADKLIIAGGSLVWPGVRGDGSKVAIIGDLHVRNQAVFRVEPWSTTVLVHGSVYLSDECSVSFPMIGTAEEPGPYDRINTPDTTPRGNFTVLVDLHWNGGTLQGKADFNVRQSFIGGGEKQIRSLAKLINRGHAEWSQGDIVMGDLGDLVNLGTFQQETEGFSFTASNLVEGSVIPIENGGDVFAMDFHSWDLDQGAPTCYRVHQTTYGVRFSRSFTVEGLMTNPS